MCCGGWGDFCLSVCGRCINFEVKGGQPKCELFHIMKDPEQPQRHLQNKSI